MKKLITFLLIILNLSLYANEDFENNASLQEHQDINASAKIGKRQGWFAGLGGGFAKTKLAYFNNFKKDRSDTYSTLATNLKAGFFLDENVGIFYSNYSSIFSAPYLNNSVNTDKFYLDAMSGFGAIYYFDTKASFFISGSVGAGVFMTLGQNNAEFGESYLVSFGYEFDNNVNVEVVLSKIGTFNSDDFNFLSAEVQSSQFIVGYTFYD